MSIRHYLKLFMGLAITAQVFADPPVEVLQSCKQFKPAKESVTMTEMDGATVKKPMDSACEDDAFVL